MPEVSMAMSYVLVAIITAVTTVLVNKIKSSVDLAAAHAGNALLEQEIREQERQSRLLVYEELAHVTQDIFEVLGAPLDDPERQEKFRRFVRLSTKVALCSPPSVRGAMNGVNDVYNDFWPALQAERQRYPEKEEALCWQTATGGLKETFMRSGEKLMDRMNEDVTRWFSR